MSPSGMWRRVDLVRTDVSKESIASILSVKNPRARNQLGQVAADCACVYVCVLDICVGQVPLFSKVHTHFICLTKFKKQTCVFYFYNELSKDNFPFEFRSFPHVLLDGTSTKNLNLGRQICVSLSKICRN
jgi:hypothetical protein